MARNEVRGAGCAALVTPAVSVTSRKIQINLFIEKIPDWLQIIRSLDFLSAGIGRESIF
jgi:hypothetical protein